MLTCFIRKWLHVFPLLLCGSVLFSSSYAQNENANPCDNTGQYLYWTGEDNSDFFNEKNWRITVELPVALNPVNGQPVKPSCLPGANSYLYSICTNTPDLVKDKHPKEGTLDPGLPISYNMLVESAGVSADGAILFACAQKGITLIHAQLNVSRGSVTRGVVSLFDENSVERADRTTADKAIGIAQVEGGSNISLSSGEA